MAGERVNSLCMGFVMVERVRGYAADKEAKWRGGKESWYGYKLVWTTKGTFRPWITTHINIISAGKLVSPQNGWSTEGTLLIKRNGGGGVSPIVWYGSRQSVKALYFRRSGRTLWATVCVVDYYYVTLGCRIKASLSSFRQRITSALGSPTSSNNSRYLPSSAINNSVTRY